MTKEEAIENNARAKFYLDYIDKEITTTGIVTTFNVGFFVFLGNKYFQKKQDISFPIESLFSLYYILPLFLIFAAIVFLLTQRSRLGFYYGMISLEMYSPGFSGSTMYKHLDEVDRWKFWYKYLFGIACVACAFILLIIFVVVHLYPDKLLSNVLIDNEWLSFVVVLISGLFEWGYIKHLNCKYPEPVSRLYVDNDLIIMTSQ